MADSQEHRWIVVCDNERSAYRTRKEAREAAARLNRHPADADIRRLGPYANVNGVARVVDRTAEKKS